MSFHDDLETAVHEQKTAYQKRVNTCVDAISVMLRGLPPCCGGNANHFHFIHPTEPGSEKRKTLDTQLLPEDEGTFATTLVLRAAAVDFWCYLRFSHFKNGNVRVSLIGSDGITCDLQKQGEENVENLTAFGQKLFKAAATMLTNNPRLATGRMVRLNEYPG